MKKITAMTFTLMIFIGLSFAHPPSEITAEYDSLGQTLKVIVEHSVRDVNKHYVSKIEIYAKGNKKIEQASVQQLNKGFQEYLYKFSDLKIGDTLNIKTSCNISGNKRVIFSLEHGTLKKLH